MGTDKSRKRMQALQSPLAGLNDSPKEGLVGDDSEDSDADSHVPSPAKRARTTTKHYAPQAAINLKKPAAKKPAACESKEEAVLKRAGEKAQRERMARMRNVQNLMKLREAEAAIERGRLERVKQIMQCILQREVVKVGLYSCIQFNHSVEAPGSTLEPIK